MSGLPMSPQNCLGVCSPVLSPVPPAGSTTDTGKSTLTSPGLLWGSFPGRRAREAPGSAGRSMSGRSETLWDTVVRVWGLFHEKLSGARSLPFQSSCNMKEMHRSAYLLPILIPNDFLKSGCCERKK
uniref:Uncharacterized protein n=1 Tax=Neogobius melanostomus TaxID=47308 RepID=A0A8C6U0P3_9GOBI